MENCLFSEDMQRRLVLPSQTLNSINANDLRPTKRSSHNIKLEARRSGISKLPLIQNKKFPWMEVAGNQVQMT